MSAQIPPPAKGNPITKPGVSDPPTTTPVSPPPLPTPVQKADAVVTKKDPSDAQIAEKNPVKFNQIRSVVHPFADLDK